MSGDEFQILTELRNTSSFHGTKTPPSASDIAEDFIEINDRIQMAVRNYIRSKSCVGLTSSKLSQDSVTLCQTFLPSYQAEDVQDWLEPFLHHATASIEQSLQVITMAAILRFVFYDEEGLFIRKDADQANSAGFKFFSRCRCLEHLFNIAVLTMYGAALPRVYVRFQRNADLEYLEERVAPNIPCLAAHLTQRLADILNDFRKPGYFFETDAPMLQPEIPDAPAMSQKILQDNVLDWRRAMEKAFSIALQLRLELTCSPHNYDYEFPKYGDKFDGASMELPAEERNYGKESRIWGCFRPLIRSWESCPGESTYRILTLAHVALI